MRFSLRALMIVVTILGLLGGLAVRFPTEAIRSSLCALPALPAAAILLFIASYSRRPVAVSILSMVGSFVGFLFSRSISLAVAKPALVRIPGEAQFHLDLVDTGFVALGLVMGPILFGGAMLIDEYCRRGKSMR